MSQLKIIMTVVSEQMKVPRLDVLSDRRTDEIARARQVFCWVARHVTKFSYARIGLYLGGKDHTSILSAVRRVEELRAEDEHFRYRTDQIRDRARVRLRGPGVAANVDAKIEEWLEVQRGRLKRLAATNPTRFEALYGAAEPEVG